MYTRLKRWIGYKWHRPLEALPVDDEESEQVEEMEKSYGNLLCDSFLSGIGVVEIIRDSLLQSSQRLMQELVTVDELNQKNELAREGMGRLSELVDFIEQHTGESIGYIDELIAVLQGINDNIDGINKLSKQTNLTYRKLKLSMPFNRGVKSIPYLIHALTGEWIQCEVMII